MDKPTPIENVFFHTNEPGFARIYYSIDDETMQGNQWFEGNLISGDNYISVPIPSKIHYLRFDLLKRTGDSIAINCVGYQYRKSIRVVLLFTTLGLDIVFIVAVFFYAYRLKIYNFIINNKKLCYIYEQTDQIFSLAISDFKNRFSGSYLGILWGVIQPLSTILLFWFVFQVGFKSGTITGYPFILWLAAGMIPWNYFYDSWFTGTNTFIAYNYIVKKVVFKIEYLPIVKALSSFLLNLIFNVILIILYTIYGHFMGIHIIDMFYYSFCIFTLSLSLTYITATLNVFVKDIGQVMGIILQVLMWMTPMMWQYSMIPESMAWFYEWNPLHYIINGYRESLINGYFFYHQWEQMLRFWLITGVLYFVGHKLMFRMKEHFADVL